LIRVIVRLDVRDDGGTSIVKERSDRIRLRAAPRVSERVRALGLSPSRVGSLAASTHLDSIASIAFSSISRRVFRSSQCTILYLQAPKVSSEPRRAPPESFCCAFVLN